MAEIYGREDGLCKGLGGSMHLIDVERGFLGTSGIVAAGIPHATGAAWAAQIRERGPGRPVLLRRRRVQAGRVPRVAEHRVAVEAADRLRDGEQRLQRPHAHRAGGRQPRRGETSRSRRRRTACPASRSTAATRSPSTRPSARPSRARAAGDGPDAGRVADLPPLRPRQHHRPARRAAALPRARGDREVRRARGVRGGAARRPGAALPRPARRRRHADRRGGRPDRRRGARRDAGRGRLRPRQPLPGARAALEYVYA